MIHLNVGVLCFPGFQDPTKVCLNRNQLMDFLKDGHFSMGILK